jgi:hypothetical protein
MALGFMKRLFGGGTPTEPAPAPPPAAPDLRAAVEEARAASRLIRRDHDPLAWAQARQLLGNALIQLAAERSGDSALGIYEEAESVLAEAIDTAGPDAHPAFLASMSNLCGYAAYSRAERLEGDAKARAYTDAAGRFGDAFAKLTPETNRALWVDLGFYRGAALQALALLQQGDDSATCLDQAAATFRALTMHGTEDGAIHPVAAYNLHIVLQNRAALAHGRAALPYLTESRHALGQAMEGPTFTANRADNEARLAYLDSAIKAAE